MAGPNVAQVDIYIENTVTAGTDVTTKQEFLRPGHWYIEQIQFTPDHTLATSATNYRTVTLTNVTDSVTLHTFVTTTTATAAGTPLVATLTEGTARILSQSDQLSMAIIGSGTGGILSGTYSLQLTQRPG